MCPFDLHFKKSPPIAGFFIFRYGLARIHVELSPIYLYYYSMKIKPWTIIVLALIHILAPAGNLLANALRSGRTVPQQVDYWFHVLPKHLLLIYLIAPILAGIFIYICRRWSYWAYLVCLGVLFISNVFGFMTQANTLNFVFLLGALVIDLLVVAYFMVPSVRKVYFDPRVRWWETALRYVYAAPVRISNTHEGVINNISTGGLFVITQAPLKENEAVRLEWQEADQSFDVNGKVVYFSPRAQGTGIRFEHTPETEIAIKNLTQKLHQQGHVVPERLPGPEDSFGAWIKKLITRREGLFPKS